MLLYLFRILSKATLTSFPRRGHVKYTSFLKNYTGFVCRLFFPPLTRPAPQYPPQPHKRNRVQQTGNTRQGHAFHQVYKQGFEPVLPVFPGAYSLESIAHYIITSPSSLSLMRSCASNSPLLRNSLKQFELLTIDRWKDNWNDEDPFEKALDTRTGVHRRRNLYK